MESIPERFMVPDGDAPHPVKNAWRPFEHGPARCIGEGLAMMEMTLALALTARELDFDSNYALWDHCADGGRPAGVPKRRRRWYDQGWLAD